MLVSLILSWAAGRVSETFPVDFDSHGSHCLRGPARFAAGFWTRLDHETSSHGYRALCGSVARSTAKTVVCTFIAVSFDLAPESNVVKRVAEGLRAASLLDVCLPSTVAFAPATYELQSQVMVSLDWENEDSKIFHWQVSANTPEFNSRRSDHIVVSFIWFVARQDSK